MNKLILITALFLLSSCAIYGTRFECEGGQGQKCTSISKINKMVDEGKIDD